MAIVAHVNGRLVEEKDAVVSVLDNGFLFGEGVYETLRTYGRLPFLAERHLRRLRASAACIDLPAPVPDVEFLARMRETIDAIEAPAEAYLRILLTRGPGDLTYDPGASRSTTVVLIARPFTPPPREFYESGATMSIVGYSRASPNFINPLVKSNNLLVNALAAREARGRGAYEGLMLNPRGEITEGATSNFFVVHHGEVLTPPLECGLLGGITRELLFELANGIGIPMHERILRLPDLLTTDEAFLTSTTREIVPVVRVDGHQVGDGRPGPVTLKLLDAYRREAHMRSTPRAQG